MPLLGFEDILQHVCNVISPASDLLTRHGALGGLVIRSMPPRDLCRQLRSCIKNFALAGIARVLSEEPGCAV